MKRIDIKKILDDPNKRREIIYAAVRFICAVERIGQRTHERPKC